MKIKYLLKGVLKSVPGVEYIYNFHKETGGTDNARYCYAVWMRHLLMAWESGYKRVPVTIAELGPGDSLGIGLAALLSGAEKYYALDVVRYSNTNRNLLVFDELVKLFRNKTPIPPTNEFPNMRPRLELESFNFPSHILTDDKMEELLDEQRLEKIRTSIRDCVPSVKPADDCIICYEVPWNDTSVIQQEAVDMIISQAVLQHVNDLPHTYRSMHSWLKKDGIMSHNIDLKSMGSSDLWYGHWTYSELQWKIVKGRKKYLINREPYSVHRKLALDNGFDITLEITDIETMPDRKELATEYRSLDKHDLTVSSLFLQAVKAKLLVLFNCLFLVGDQIAGYNLCVLV